MSESSDEEFQCPIDGCHKSFKSKHRLSTHHYQIHKRHSKVRMVRMKLLSSSLKLMLIHPLFRKIQHVASVQKSSETSIFCKNIQEFTFVSSDVKLAENPSHIDTGSSIMWARFTATIVSVAITARNHSNHNWNCEFISEMCTKKESTNVINVKLHSSIQVVSPNMWKFNMKDFAIIAVIQNAATQQPGRAMLSRIFAKFTHCWQMKSSRISSRKLQWNRNDWRKKMVFIL